MPTPDDIAELAPKWVLPHRPGIHTDPIWMEYALASIDPGLRNQLSAIRLQTVASVYRAIAEGAESAAKAVSAAQSGD
jgi:hypothetical protein